MAAIKDPRLCQQAPIRMIVNVVIAARLSRTKTYSQLAITSELDY